jgi:hypothetical protein
MAKRARAVGRRSFLLASAGAATSMRARARPQAATRPSNSEEIVEAFIPTIIVTELDRDRLVAIDKGSRIESRDLGRSWTEPVPCLQEGKPLAGVPNSIRRLRDGTLGMIYLESEVVRTASYVSPRRGLYFCSSADDGRTWSAGRLLDVAGGASPDRGISEQHPHAGSLVQLSTGRLVQPLYWYLAGRHEEWQPEYRGDAAFGTMAGKKIGADGHTFEAAMGGCYAYYSDDVGRTWQRSTGSIMVWPLPGEGNVGGFGATFEPVVVELRDGRLLMFLRNTLGRIFQSTSRDGGIHWSLARPTELASGDVPCRLGRLPSTGHLVVVWNQASGAEIKRGYSRGRLSTAVSRDEGATWEHFRTLERSAGLDAVEHATPPPVAPIRADRNLGVLPDGYARYDYPNLAFVQGKIAIHYGMTTYPGGTAVARHKLKVLPESWLYG